MFDEAVIKQVVSQARDKGIDPAGLLAVVEVESAGRPLEADGRTPRLLFERHVFYRELRKLSRERLDRAITLGLANKKWSPRTQYKDQGSSAKRLSLLERAKAVDEDTAYRSCSWGVGQTMGFLALELGFSSATEMVESMLRGGIPAQVDCMVREIMRKHLDQKINSRDWAGFARVYNGPGYRRNRYDTKMAVAFSQWTRKIDSMVLDTPPEVEEELPDSRMTEPPKGMAKSKTGAASVVTGAGAATVAVEQLQDVAFKAKTAKDTVESLGFMGKLEMLAQKPAFWVCVVIVLAAAFIWWDRRRKLVEDHV